MPVLLAPRDQLFFLIGRSFTDDQFDELCFSFGIELDEVTSERRIIQKETATSSSSAAYMDGSSDETLYKIEIPANRFDLLSTEGLATALRVYLGLESIPVYRLALPPKEAPPLTTMHVHQSVQSVRPYVYCAILRGVQFNKYSYDSFISFQDKLHATLARHRSLASMGTHDLDLMSPPFSYEAQDPSSFSFVALNQTQEHTGLSLVEHYERNDPKLKKYVPLIKDSPLYPIVLDARRTICSLPPLINSDATKISLNTRNIFIEVTATVPIKGEMVLRALACAFSYYTTPARYSVEPVRVLYEPGLGPNGSSEWSLDLTPREWQVSTDYFNRGIGVQLSQSDVQSYLQRMMFPSQPLSPDTLLVLVPAVRSDVLHPCDLVEDVAIGYGFTRIAKTIPRTLTIGRPNPLNKLSDAVRQELAYVGYTEGLTLTLHSLAENGPLINQPKENERAVVLSNPTTAEYQVVRTQLLSGLLKMAAAGRSVGLPLRLFEVSDVVHLSTKTDTGAKNERRVAAMFVGTKSAFELVHGVLDHMMNMLGAKRGPAMPGAQTYRLVESSNESYFPGRRADLLLNDKQIVGSMGVIHPALIEAFEVHAVATAFEFNLEPFL